MSSPDASTFVDDSPPTVSELFDEIEILESLTDDPSLRARLDELKELAGDVQEGGTFGQIIYGFDRHDVAEAVLGSLLFGIPMAVEGGTNDVGAFLASNVAALAATVVGTIALVYSILYVAEIQDVRVSYRILGLVPRRLVGVPAVAVLMATVLLTMWGRVDWVADSWLAFCTVVVASVPMTIGAALGDILPGS